MSSDVRVPRIGEGRRGATEGYLAYLLRQADHAVRVELDRTLAAFDLTGPQFLVMTMIEAYPGACGADIARLAQLTPQTVNTITRNLARASHVTRRSAAEDGRIIRFGLTERGRQRLLEARERAREIDARVRASLSTEEERIVRGWLVTVAAAFPDSDRVDAEAAAPG